MPRADPATLIREHQAGVWRYVRYLGANSAEADDLVQETFLAVLRRPFEERSRPETAAYLRTAARRRLLMLRRKMSREGCLVGPPRRIVTRRCGLGRGGGETGLDDYLSALRECLQSAVTERDRTAITFQYAQKASCLAIADELGITVEGVKTLVAQSQSQTASRRRAGAGARQRRRPLFPHCRKCIPHGHGKSALDVFD